MAVGAALAVALSGRGDASLRWPRVGAAALLAGLSHVLLDDLASATYHPAQPLWDSPFWVGFHLLAVVATVVLAWRCRRQWIVMAAALTPDLDWLLGRPLGLWEPGALHGWFRELPGVVVISSALQGVVPDLRAEPVAALSEIVLVGLLWAYVHRDRASAGTPEACRPTSSRLRRGAGRGSGSAAARAGP